MSEQPEKKTGRIAQARQAYSAIKSLDPKLGWWMLFAALGTAANNIHQPKIGRAHV